MDHKLITLDEAIVLLDRIEDEGWQVCITTFTDVEHRYDEWVKCENPHVARAYIADFSDASAGLFLTRAHDWEAQQHRMLDVVSV